MTEYGRGPGSESWYPEDPLYGDLGYGGPQDRAGQSVHPDQHPRGQPPHDGRFPAAPPPSYDGRQRYDPQTMPQQVPGPGHPRQPETYDPWSQDHGYGQGHGQGPDMRQAPGHYPGHGTAQDPAYGGPYDGGQHAGAGQHGQVPYGADPYVAGMADPYGQQFRGHHAESPAYGSAPADGGYPPAQPMAPGPGGPVPPTARRRPGPPGPQRRPDPEPEPPADWDPGPDRGEHAFFAGDADDGDAGDDFDSGGLGQRRGRGGKGKKGRNGCACLLVAVVLAGGVGGAGYYGYQFYEDHFGPPPDYSGDGTNQTVTVDIPAGSGGYTIGQLLKQKGVVKSVDAFVQAEGENPQGKNIQDGVYTLKKEMSAASVVALMLDPKSRNNLIIAEGRRNAWVYLQIDLRLGLKAGTTRSVAKKDAAKLGLPDWARNHENVKDPLEGFLYPSSYPVAKGMRPQDVLKRMVAEASRKYAALDLDQEAQKLHVSGPWQLITIASLVQAEGKTHDDFRKMSEVVYNRLKSSNTQTNQLLQFDSTFNYLKGQSKINISDKEVNGNQDPYNTYTQKGLPPGPIGNPGAEALAAALNPTHDGWFYFVATDGMNKTEFARTYADFQKLKEKFDDQSGSN